MTTLTNTLTNTLPAISANTLHAMDAARTNKAIECIIDGLDYGMYAGWLMQAVKADYYDFFLMSEREYTLLSNAYTNQQLGGLAHYDYTV